MKIYNSFLVTALYVVVTIPIHATLIVYGTLNGTVVATEGNVPPVVGVTVGMPVSGYFSYDYDLLSSPDASGLRTVAASDAVSSFSIWTSNGIGGVGGGGLFDTLDLVVGVNGLPYGGYCTTSGLNISIGPDYVTGVFPSGHGILNDWTANVTYTITGVPDVGATWFLLGLGLVGITVAQRVFRAPFGSA